MIAPQPPGPGLPSQAPSVKISTVSPLMWMSAGVAASEIEAVVGSGDEPPLVPDRKCRHVAMRSWMSSSGRVPESKRVSMSARSELVRSLSLKLVLSLSKSLLSPLMLIDERSRGPQAFIGCGGPCLQVSQGLMTDERPRNGGVW